MVAHIGKVVGVWALGDPLRDATRRRDGWIWTRSRRRMRRRSMNIRSARTSVAKQELVGENLGLVERWDINWKTRKMVSRKRSTAVLEESG